MKDELGNRMKANYENRTAVQLPRRTYTIIRIDGKAFHTYTKGCEKPFDIGLVEDMNDTAKYLCKNIQGAKIGFVQSDEISILMTDFETHETDAWFDGKIQKIVSVASSMATAKFNQLRWMRYVNDKYNNSGEEVSWTWFEGMRKLKLAEFDARTFTIPAKSEVMNYFIWRQQDTIRNSISSVAQSMFSTKELEGKNMSVQLEMILENGTDWNDYDSELKRGRFIYKESYLHEGRNLKTNEIEKTKRTHWVARACPVFSQEPEFLNMFIPDLD